MGQAGALPFYNDSLGYEAGGNLAEILANHVRLQVRVLELVEEPAGPGRLEVAQHFFHGYAPHQRLQVLALVFLEEGGYFHRVFQPVQHVHGALGQRELVGGRNVNPPAVFKGENADYHDDAGESGQHDCRIHAVPPGPAEERGNNRTQGDEGYHANEESAKRDVDVPVEAHGLHEGHQGESCSQGHDAGQHNRDAEGCDAVQSRLQEAEQGAG